MTRKKISYEQDQALARGRQVARANQRRRVAAKEAAERTQSEREAAAKSHDHEWKNWDYVRGFTHEVRECRSCGYAEIRPVRPLRPVRPIPPTARSTK